MKNTEDWRKAIFALMLFSVVVGLPEGLMGFAARFLTQLFRIDPPALPPASALDTVLPAKTPDGGPLLNLQDLKRYFGGVKAVDGVSMTVQIRQIHGLIGPNGSGKSTAVNVISGLYAPSAGNMLLHGKALPKGMFQCGAHRCFAHLSESAAFQ